MGFRQDKCVLHLLALVTLLQMSLVSLDNVESDIQGHKEWLTEVNVLGIVDHPNLVKLLGYCAHDD